jgi:Oligosaccharyl transferase STT3 subunit
MNVCDFYESTYLITLHNPLPKLNSFVLIFYTVDPWFNFRATKYLVENGFYKFWDWFDDSKSIWWAWVEQEAWRLLEVEQF